MAFTFSVSNNQENEHSPVQQQKNTKTKMETINTRIYFSGLWWKITHHPNTPRSPGKNYWSAKNVWVDQKGLHLKLTKDVKTGKWYCAQVVSEKKFGYGTYQFFINGKVDQLDKNVVLGLFNYSGVDYHDEIDIEFAKWGQDTTANLHYTVWPAEKKKSPEWKSVQHLSFAGSTSTHRFKRTQDQVHFQSLKGYQHANLNEMYAVSCKEKIASHKLMPILVNLWLFQNYPPSDQHEVEVIIKAFKFIPL